MGAFFFVCGSAAGAVLAWLLGLGERSRSTIVAVNGAACALSGMLAVVGGGMTSPVAQAGWGLLGTVTPLTWCATPVAVGGGVVMAVRRCSSTLVLSLACGIGCAVVGFALAYGVKYDGHKEFVGEPATWSIGRS